MIEFVGHGNGQRFRDRQEITSFWEVLADQAVGVFISAAFPSRVRMAEIEGGIQGFRNLYVFGELFAIITGDRKDPIRERKQQGDGGLLHQICLTPLYPC